jgi:cytochrome c-type protein NapB
MSTDGGQGSGIPARWLQVGAAVAVALAATGYFAGLRTPEVPERPVASDPHVQREERVPSYGELRDTRRGANARMYEGAIASLVEEPFPVKPLPVATPEQRAQAVARRKTHRAYDGAPPTIPHEIDQSEVPGCLACHGEGMKLGNRVAPKISHPPYQSCTQCHVVGDSPRPLAPYKDTPGNNFVGLASAGNGARSHPERRNCQQCHGSSARLDQRVSGLGGEGGRP